MKKLSRKLCILLLIVLLISCFATFTACQTSGKNIKSYITRTECWSSTTDEGTVWSIRCFVNPGKFTVDSADKIVVNINGKKITATIPTYSTQNCFDVEYLDTKNSGKEPTIRSCYAYFGNESGDSDSNEIETTDPVVIIIVGAVLLVIGAVMHFIAVTSDIPILTYIPGGVFVLCVIGAFAFSTTEGFVMLAFFAVYWIACRIITRFFLD